MKLLSKLSTLIQAVARGPAGKQPEPPHVPDKAGGERALRADVERAQQADAEQAVQPAQTAQLHTLEGDRVADLLQRKLAPSEAASQENEKGD